MDSTTTLSALNNLIHTIQRTAYAEGQASMQAKVDSLQHLLSGTQANPWTDMVVGLIIGLSIGSVLLAIVVLADRKACHAP